VLFHPLYFIVFVWEMLHKFNSFRGAGFAASPVVASG